MFESLSQRTVIIGNSGAGKSALAESLAASIHVPVIDLDLLNWEGNGYGRKRDEDAASPRRGATDQDTVELLKWAETYWNRQTPSSFAGHSRMFANFPSTKFRLETREQATILLADLRACMIALKGDE